MPKLIATSRSDSGFPCSSYGSFPDSNSTVWPVFTNVTLGTTSLYPAGSPLHWFLFMFHSLEKRIAEALASRIERLYSITTPVQTEQPKQSSFGEIAAPAAFQLARQLKKAPK